MDRENVGAPKTQRGKDDQGGDIILSGVIEHIRYHSQDTGYTIARVRLQGDDEPYVSVVAHLPSPKVGDLYQFTGSWVEHPKYGRQFQASRFEAKPPVTLEGIKVYLASEIDEIGPELAKRIVDAFGMDTFAVIDREPIRLREVSGIGPKRAEAIIAEWKDRRTMRNTFVFLYSQGITAGLASKVFRRYGPATVDLIRNNPFRLAMDIPGVGFMTADRIAEKTGMSRSAPERICAGIVYTLELAAMHGHTYLPLRILAQETEKLLHVEKRAIMENIAELESMNFLYREKAPGGPEGEDTMYHPDLYRAEKGAALDLRTLASADKATGALDAQGAIAWMEERHHMELSPRQKEAVLCAASSACMVLTGGPGTGKTTTISAIIRMFTRIGARILMCAPTGRAAKRMTETTGKDACTIHRLLEYNPMQNKFQRNADDPLEADLIIADEFSMVDITLLSHLLEAVTPGTTMVFVGDVDQLPSVGPGNCLKNIITSGIVEVVRLDTIFRQGSTSMIVLNSHRINKGAMPIVPEHGTGEYLFIPEEDPERILQEIIRQVTEELPIRHGLDSLWDIQVLSPMHKGTLGVENLNRHLQKALNPSGRPHHRGAMEFRVGDKVMQTRNNYELEVFNGDIGHLIDIDEKDGSFQVSYDERTVSYSPADADDLVVAYATTIHKAQGSEYPAVILPVHTQHYVMLARNLLYTAVSRGKRLVLTIGSERAVRLSVENNRSRARFTRFAQRLAGQE